MRRVVLLDPLWPLEGVDAALAGLDVVVEKADVATGDDVVAVLAAPEQEIRADVLGRCPNLLLAGTCSTGYDNLDVDALSDAGVMCLHVSGYCDEEVAEHAIALATGLLRGVHRLDRHVRDGGWWPYPLEPRRVRGSRLGIIGLGRIGRLVAALGQANGMPVAAFDPAVDAREVRALGVEPLDLDALLATSDVVTLHAPLVDATRHLIDADALGRMRPDAYLVNCARAGLVDHAALGAALAAGEIAGAAIDVLPVEPPGRDEPALGWPNLVLQPHASWYSPEASLAPYRRQIDDLARVLRGERPQGLIREVGA
ncbi:MAG: putative glycerate dehydrogenase [Actinomycetota bacterium]